MLFAVTANAFSGGSNTGTDFTEAAGYGEHLVELDPDLDVISSSHPADITQPEDLDFVGSPVVLDRPGCGELVVAADKNDEVYGWRGADVDDGPLWSLPLQPFDEDDPMLSQLAWSPSLDSLYAVTGTQLVRVAISASCTASVVWARPLGTDTENGSPTIAGNTIWFTVNGKPRLLAYDAQSGKLLSTLPLGGTTLTAPTIVDDRLVVGTFTGLVEGFSFGAPVRTLSSAGTSASNASGVSWAGADDAWETRSSGVFSTENAGRTWQKIYAEPALEVLRLSADAGLIELGTAPGECMCTTRALWTDNDGATWRATVAVGSDFTGGDGEVYWWSGGSLHEIAPFPPADPAKPLDAKLALTVPDGTIVDGIRTADGFAFLVSNRVAGRHWDTSPRVVLIGVSGIQTIQLPSAPNGQILAQSITADGPDLTVNATNFGVDPVAPVTWTSDDSGQTWSLSA